MKARVGVETGEHSPRGRWGEGVGACRPSILEPILGPSFPTVNALGPKVQKNDGFAKVLIWEPTINPLLKGSGLEIEALV